MIQNNRILSKISGTTTDHSVVLNHYPSGTATIAMTSADALYLGSDMPMNHKWIKVSSANAVASVASIETWNGAEWVTAVDVIDQTAVSGASLAASGILSWTPNRYTAWGRQNSSEEISDISTTKIYNLYWVRLKFSATLTAGTALAYVGHKFSEDTDLFAEYPVFNDTALMGAHTTGKTSWEEQTVSAAEDIIKDLKAQDVIWAEGQILSPDQFRKASIHKTAEIIYRAFSADYEKEIALAKAEYKKAIDIRYFMVDANGNATLDPLERATNSTNWLTR